ncbi:MAG: hypothetical protein GX621_06270 [Pirellulaceae bacterium]|nr:hypothetical protein [Pirellulaceae bacterium]
MELTFGKAHHSDLVIELDAARDEEYLSPEFQVTDKAFDLFFDVGNCIQNDMRGIETLDLRRDDRTYLLRAFEGLLPGVDDEYRIEIENCSREQHPKLDLSSGGRSSVRKFLAREVVPASADEAIVVGELVKIHVDVGPHKITVLHKSREIDCHYSESMRDQIANLLAGSVVEVSGKATLDDTGAVKKLDVVFDVDTISMEPLRIPRFEHEGARYALREPLCVEIEFTDGLWVYHNSDINLWGYGERREEALRDLHANFDYLWKEIAQEDDSRLDSLAQGIKRQLKQIVAAPGEN